MVGDEPLSPGRLEAFSDGVIAIILTIMVLELKAPASADPKRLLHEWPIFISYVISYFYVAVYWINHHHLFHRVKRVDLPILWANIAVLFCMSLIPFFTEWMESTRLSAFPTAVYAADDAGERRGLLRAESCRWHDSRWPARSWFCWSGRRCART